MTVPTIDLPISTEQPIVSQQVIHKEVDKVFRRLLISSRETELNDAISAINTNQDLAVIGVSGSGREPLVMEAAQRSEAVAVIINCMRAIDRLSFLILLCTSLNTIFLQDISLNSEDIEKLLVSLQADYRKDEFLIQWNEEGLCVNHNLLKEQMITSLKRNKDSQCSSTDNEELALIVLLELIDELAKQISSNKNIRTPLVITFKNTTHLNSWDSDDRLWSGYSKKMKWLKFIKDRINKMPAVSYIQIETFGENISPKDTSSLPEIEPKAIKLYRLENSEVRSWIINEFYNRGFTFAPDGGLDILVNAVMGHADAAVILTRQLLISCIPGQEITIDNVIQVIEFLIEDLETIFVSLLLLLPDNQMKLLECLAKDPTDKPQLKEYAEKHCLKRGGSLKGALDGLVRKGLIYSAEYNYSLALPLLALWINRRLSI